GARRRNDVQPLVCKQGVELVEHALLIVAPLPLELHSIENGSGQAISRLTTGRFGALHDATHSNTPLLRKVAQCRRGDKCHISPLRAARLRSGLYRGALPCGRGAVRSPSFQSMRSGGRVVEGARLESEY